MVQKGEWVFSFLISSRRIVNFDGDERGFINCEMFRGEFIDYRGVLCGGFIVCDVSFRGHFMRCGGGFKVGFIRCGEGFRSGFMDCNREFRGWFVSCGGQFGIRDCSELVLREFKS